MSTNPVPETPIAKPSKSLFSVLWLRSRPGELVVYHHSTLFYWWPVWLLGFILTGITYFEDHRLALVPPETKPSQKNQEVVVGDKDGKEFKEDRAVLILPKNQKHLQHKDADNKDVHYEPHIIMSAHKGMGVLFVAVLLLVILITNVPMRGLWSVLVILVLVSLTVIFEAAGLWEGILARVRHLAVHINLSGYLIISLFLFGVWAFNFFLFDRKMYLIFTPGQVRARVQIGGGETIYDTMGMTVQKKRGDLFRHWILGFGSGDLIVRPARSPEIDVPNVLCVGWVVKQIEMMIKEKMVVGGGS